MKIFTLSHLPGRKGTLAAVATALCLVAGTAGASQLVYTPIDPSFGGNPLNGTFLLSIANQEAQENAPNPLDSTGLDLTSLGNSLNSLDKDINNLNNNICSQGTSTTCTPSTTSGGTTNSLMDSGLIK